MLYAATSCKASNDPGCKRRAGLQAATAAFAAELRAAKVREARAPVGQTAGLFTSPVPCLPDFGGYTVRTLPSLYGLERAICEFPASTPRKLSDIIKCKAGIT